MSHHETKLDHQSEHEGSSKLQTQYQNPNGGANSNDLSRQISVQLTSQQFEELYLQPSQKSRQQGQLIKALGNPTVLGIICFILNLLPTSLLLMGLRSTTANGLLGLVGVYYFVGGLGMTVAGLLEFVIGNTFPFVVFFTFGVFWLSLGAFVDPVHQVQSLLAEAPADLYAPFGFYLLTWGIYVVMLTIASLRTNVTLVWILFHVAMVFLTLAGGYFHIGNLNAETGTRLLTAAGAFGFCACIGGFYILFHLLLASTDFPFNVPLGDLSSFLARKKPTPSAA